MASRCKLCSANGVESVFNAVANYDRHIEICPFYVSAHGGKPLQATEVGFAVSDPVVADASEIAQTGPVVVTIDEATETETAETAETSVDTKLDSL